MSRIESKGLFCQNQPLKHVQNHGDPWYGVILLDYESSAFFLGDSKSEQNASARENHPTRERRDAAVREKPHFSLFPPRLTFLAWGDFQEHSSFARSTIPEGR